MSSEFAALPGRSGQECQQNYQPAALDVAVLDETLESPEGHTLERQIAIADRFVRESPEILAGDFLEVYQKDALEGIGNCLENWLEEGGPPPRMACVQSMGTGKTITAMAFLDRCGTGRTVTAPALFDLCGVGREISPTKKRVRALWVAHENHLLENARGLPSDKDDRKRGIALVNPDVTMTLWAGNEHDASGDIIGISGASLRDEWGKHKRGEHSNIPFDEIDVLVVDECDMELGENVSECIADLQKDRISLGLTGTPTLVNGKNIFGMWPDLIAYMDMRQAIEVYGLTGNERPLAFVTLAPDEAMEIESLNKDGSLQDSDIQRLLRREAMQLFVQDLAVRFTEQDLKSVFFTPRGNSSEFARNMAENLKDREITRRDGSTRPVSVRAVGSFDPIGSRVALLNFGKDVDVLASARMGEAGWDPEDLNVVVIVDALAPQKEGEPRSVMQRIGRLLHNREQDTPLLVVFLHYDIFNKETQEYVRLVTQHDLFGLPVDRVSVLNACIKSPERLPAPQQTRDFRPPTLRQPARQRPMPEPQPLAGRHADDAAAPKPVLPESLRESLATLIQQYPLQQKTIDVITSGRYAKDPHADEWAVAKLAKLACMEPRRLLAILREQHYAPYSRTQLGKRTFYVNGDLSPLDDVIAGHGDYSVRRMADKLNTSRGTIERGLRDIGSDVPQTANPPQRYDREAPGDRRVRKSGQYDELVFAAVAAVIQNRALPILPGEVPQQDIVRATRRSPKKVAGFLREQGYAAVIRSLAGVPTEATCYKIPEPDRAAVIEALTLPPPLPNDGKKRVTAGTISRQYLRNIGFSTDDVEQLMRDGPFNSERFTVGNQSVAWCLDADNVQAFNEYVRRGYRDGSLQGSLPARTKPKTAQTSTTAEPTRSGMRVSLEDVQERLVGATLGRLAHEAHQLGLDVIAEGTAMTIPDTAVPALIAAANARLRQEAAQTRGGGEDRQAILDFNRGRPAQPRRQGTAYRAQKAPVRIPVATEKDITEHGLQYLMRLATERNQPLPLIEAIIRHHVALDGPRYYIDEETKQTMAAPTALEAAEALLEDYQNMPRLHRSWQLVDNIAAQTGSDPDQLRASIVRQSFGNEHVRVFPAGDKLRHDLVFCSPTLVKRIVSARKNHARS